MWLMQIESKEWAINLQEKSNEKINGAAQRS
jgi:hypothetical protein